MTKSTATLIGRLGLAVLPLASAVAVFAPSQASAAAVVVESTTVAPARITSGQEAIQTVTLAEPAPAGGIEVTLLDGSEYGDLTYLQATHHRVVVPAGQRSISFPIRVQHATHDGAVTRLTAEVGSSVAETTLAVDQIDGRYQELDSFTVDREIALTGTKVTGTVKIKSPAPIGGLSVDLRRSPYEATAVYHPYYVVVPSGGTTASFTMDASSDDFPRSVQVDANVGTDHESVSVTAVPKHFSIAAIREVRKNTNVNNYGVVGLGNRPHPFGATIKFTSDTPGISAYIPQSLPASIPWNQVGSLFGISVDPAIPTGTKARITATWILGPSPVTTEITVVD